MALGAGGCIVYTGIYGFTKERRSEGGKERWGRGGDYIRQQDNRIIL